MAEQVNETVNECLKESKIRHYSYHWSGLTSKKGFSALIPSRKPAGAQLKFYVNFFGNSYSRAAKGTAPECRFTAGFHLVNGAKNVKFVYYIQCL